MAFTAVFTQRKVVRSAVLSSHISLFFDLESVVGNLYSGVLVNFFNTLIKQCIKFRKPFAIGKIGETECRNLVRMINSRSVVWSPDLEINAGVFPLTNDCVKMWANEYLASLASLDLVLQWGEGDKFLIEKFAKGALVCHDFDDIQPFIYGSDGWHYALSGIKLCVVHPMKSTIEMQAQVFSSIWRGAEPIDLVCVKSPYPPVIGGSSPFASYHEALASLKEEVGRYDFDLCVVGAGAYSLPLCSYVRKLGKVCIHLGGATQLLFGIRGGRWDAWVGPDGTWNGYYANSEFWRHPMKSDVPDNAYMVEGGCYW